MAEQIKLGNPPIAVTVRRSARARRYSLRISATDGAVSLTVPKRGRIDDAIDFARTKEGWLRAHLADRPEVVQAAYDTQFPLEGSLVTIVPGQGRAVRVDGGMVQVPGAADRVGARLRGFLQELARDRLTAASDRYARALGQGFTRITLRDTRSRWGSCTDDGRLMYSWRLILAPPEVLDYVAAHEVAHLAEMNHSAAFWGQVGRLCPGYEQPRRWLRKNGPGLHRYQF